MIFYHAYARVKEDINQKANKQKIVSEKAPSAPTGESILERARRESRERQSASSEPPVEATEPAVAEEPAVEPSEAPPEAPQPTSEEALAALARANGMDAFLAVKQPQPAAAIEQQGQLDPETQAALQRLDAEYGLVDTDDTHDTAESEPQLPEIDDSSDISDIVPNDKNGRPYSPVKRGGKLSDDEIGMIREHQGEIREYMAEQDANKGYEFTEDQQQVVKLLGVNYRVQRRINEIGNGALRRIQSAWANVRNVPTGFRRRRHERQLDRAEADHDAIQERLGEATNEVHRKILHKRAEEARQRLEARRETFQRTDGLMRSRVEKIDHKFDSRREEKLTELKQKREQALARKALRTEMREQGMNNIEVNEAMAAIPKEHLDRIGRVALTTEAYRRQASDAEKSERKAHRRHERLENHAVNVQEQIARYQAHIDSASGIVAKIRDEQLPEAQADVKKYEEWLADMPEGEEHDMDRQYVRVELQEAQDRVDRFNNRELPYWQRVIAESEAEVASLEKIAGKVSGAIDRQETTVKKAADEVGRRQEAYGERQDGLERTINRSLNDTQAGGEE